ncbi:MAG: cysteine desulfurase family protein [Desulfitobacteriaceae bacterium]
MTKVYLDYNASTPIAPEVAEAMIPFLTDYYGNPSTNHWAGKPAKDAYEKARRQVADLLNCGEDEVVITSGGSEANNHALKGIFYALKEKGNHIITTQIEHPAILNPCKFLEKLGAKVTHVGVDRYGQVSPAGIEKAITDKTILISVMHANNEVGTIQPIAEISRIAKKYNILVHTDAAQSVGKIPTRVDELGVDLLSVAGHKLYAPKGIGALYIRRGTPIEPFVHGAGHEGGRRAGTENIILAAGLGKACELALASHPNPTIKELRDYFWRELRNYFTENIVLNGHPEERLPNTLNVSFVGKLGQDILAKIPGLAASTGSACHAGTVELSPVLKAMKVDEEVGKGAIRFSLGRYTTKEEIDLALQWLKERV